MNMRVSKKTEYGLMAMVHLAKNPKEVISLKNIAKATRAPFDFLEKIFSQLEKAKLVKAKKGAYGGYFLGKPANKITPGDVVMVLEENIAKSHCTGCPMMGGCTSKDVWSEVQESLDVTLNAITLADLAKGKKK